MKNPIKADGTQKFPKPFISKWMDDCSMTIDCGQRFHFEVDEDGFHVRRESGLWSVDDLFYQMEYWPRLVVWSDANKRLKPLLESAASASGMDYGELLSLVKSFFSNIDALDFDLYLKQEEASGDDWEVLSRTRAKHANHFEDYKIPGLTSNEFREGSCYAGLTLQFNGDGWQATLFLPEEDEMFQDDFWEAETFDEVITANNDYGMSLDGYLRWSRQELASLLIESDRRWEPFVAHENKIDE